MYSFIDVNEVQGSAALPSEALSINGVYIENKIAGYRTMYVEGRESLESEISEMQVGYSDGARYQEKRDVSRTLTIHYQMLCSDAEDFRDKFNVLCGLLDQKQAKLIFADETDKYYIGTKSSVEQPNPGRLNVTGAFSFYCADPYKYGVAEKTASNAEDSAQITLSNAGTKAVPVSLKIKMKSDNGYIGLTLDDRFYQIGKPEEVDGVTHDETVMLFDDHLWEDKGWLVNQGITPPVTPERLQNGTITYVHEELIEGYVKVNDYGTGNWWHGAAVTKIVPADANGKYPVNWISSWRFDFNTAGGSAPGSQIGHNSVTFSDENDDIIVAVVFEDNNASYERSDMVIYIGDTRIWDTKETTDFYLASREGGPVVAVEKIGSQITVSFSYAGIKKTFRAVNPNAELRKITWYGAAYIQHKPLTNNLLRALQLKKHNVERHEDIPNYFAAGDEVYIDGEKNKVYINNIYDADMVDIGSQPLLLPPGQHTLGIVTSSFSEVPEVEVTWRERWI